MRPLNIREAPRPGGTSGPFAGSGIVARREAVPRSVLAGWKIFSLRLFFYARSMRI